MADEQILKNMSSLGITDTAWVANTDLGGQLGLGLRAPNLDASAPLVLPNVVPIVIHTPTMYNDNLPMQYIMKNMVECFAKSITGIDVNYTEDFDETPVGHDGQNLSFPKKTKRAGINPNIIYQELLGNPFWNAHRKWMTDFQNPDTNVSYVGMSDELTIVPSHYSMSVLFIQYDLTHRPDNIIDAFIVSNMFPQETGALGSEKQIAEHRSIERSISYTGLLHHTNQIRLIAKEVATAMAIHTVNYWKDAPSISQGVEGHIQSNIIDTGLSKDIQVFLEQAGG